MAVYTLEARLALAVEIAEEAGQMIRNAREQQGFSQRLKGGIELVTDVDVAVDTLISQRLEEYFPEEARPPGQGMCPPENPSRTRCTETDIGKMILTFFHQL